MRCQLWRTLPRLWLLHICFCFIAHIRCTNPNISGRLKAFERSWWRHTLFLFLCIPVDFMGDLRWSRHLQLVKHFFPLCSSLAPQPSFLYCLCAACLVPLLSVFQCTGSKPPLPRRLHTRKRRRLETRDGTWLPHVKPQAATLHEPGADHPHYLFCSSAICSH